MEYVALFSGILIGFLYLRRRMVFDWVLIYFVFHKYRDRKKFYHLFDLLKDEIIMQYIDGLGIVNNYDDLKKIHKEARPSAYKKSRYYYGYVTRMVFTRVVPICLFPAIIFWNNWYYYIAGVLAIMACLLLYISIVEPGGFARRRDTIVIGVINKFIEEKDKDAYVKSKS